MKTKNIASIIIGIAIVTVIGVMIVQNYSFEPRASVFPFFESEEARLEFQTNELIKSLQNDNLDYSQKRALVASYNEAEFPNQRYLNYKISGLNESYELDEKIEFTLIEFGQFTECWNLRLKILDYNSAVELYDDAIVRVCLEPDGIPGTYGSFLIETICQSNGVYDVIVSNDDIFPERSLARFVCGEPEPEPERTTEDEMNLRDARLKLSEIYSLNSSFGPFNIKDVIVGYGIADGVLVVDVLTEYYESDHLNLIKQKIRDIVGHKVTIEFSPSGAIVPTNVESVFPYVWNGFLHRNGIEFTPKEQTYANNDEGYAQRNRVCSPIIASNGTEFYVSSTFILEPFKITGTFVDKIKPDDCYKIWKTDTILEEPDRTLMLWLENYHKDN